jgi:hypothetical protein
MLYYFLNRVYLGFNFNPASILKSWFFWGVGDVRIFIIIGIVYYEKLLY